MSGLSQMVESRENSPISGLLNQIPKTIETASEVIGAVRETPIIPFSNLFSKPKPEPEPVDTDVEAEDEYDPLSSEEIKVKAESKAEMTAAIMTIIFTFANRYLAAQRLSKDDERLINEHQDEAARTGLEPVYPPGHPYHGARQRWEEFMELLKFAEEDSALEEGQMKLLRRAFESDLRAKNKRGKLKQGGIWETLFEIFMVKAIAPASQWSMTKFSSYNRKRA